MINAKAGLHRYWWIGIITAILVTALIIGAGVLVSVASETTLRSDQPLNGAAASEAATGLSLPANSSDVFFLFHSGGLQDLERYVTFTVPSKDVDSCVDQLIAENNRSLGKELNYLTQPLSSMEVVTARKEFLPMPWWRPSSIRSGYYRGETSSYALRIWADIESGTIYVYQND